MIGTELLLSDLRVIELGHIVSGPSVGLILADLGADVIKMERPEGGDQSRARADESLFLTFNRNKRSMVLDLKSSRGKEIFGTLLKTADIVVDNYAPGVMEKLGLGYDTLSGINPGILYCSIKGFLPGPYGDRPLLDEPAQMMGGLAYMTGPPGQPLRAGASIIDISAALFGIVGLLAALHQRKETGRGRRVQVGLFETTVFFVAQHMAMAGVTGQCPPPVPERLKGKGVGWAIYRIFITQDQRQVFIGITGDAHWERFCREFQVEDLWEDLSLRTNLGRVQKHGLVNERVQKIVSEIPLGPLTARLEKSQIPHSVINTPMDLFQDPHLRARNHFLSVTGPGGATTELPGLPLVFDSDQAGVRRQPPKLGQHTEEIMRELGYSPEQIAILKETGVLRSPA
jgi:crotonobetainyl-CoA:carnitine CoA-transferase CaiB-like acyl-CoA transferase